MANSERPRVPGVPRLPDGFYYQVGRADHHSVLVKVMKISANRRVPMEHDVMVMTREIGETEVPNWLALDAAGRVTAALIRVGEQWIKKYNEDQMTQDMRRYVGAFDAAGAPL